ncbi:MAG: acyltransferase family protein [Sandaracinaceae bacterium]|nr:acyltransferase family protein [Sandaracinaceae bacterium]
MRWRDAGHGYDRLGLHPAWVEKAIAAASIFYDWYFRVESHGAEHIPTEGGVILAANHSGMLPIDGAMLCVDLLRHGSRPARVVADTFVPGLPFVSTFFSRVGVVGGERSTIRRLLDDGELVVVFPEGTPGIGKPYRDRYRLQEWRVGHAELALRHRVPVVPVAIIGAEEQWPQIARLPIHAFGAPYLPIPLTPLPLPVKYHIWYGEPLRLYEHCPAESADDPEVAEEAAAWVKKEVAGLIAKGLEQRRGIFR